MREPKGKRSVVSKRRPFARLIEHQKPKRPKRKWRREERPSRPCPGDAGLPFGGW
jgi:hypothetical protein